MRDLTNPTEDKIVVLSTLKKFKNKLDTSKIINITYGDLVELYKAGKLIPGQKYRITDYVTTTTKENTQSAGHPFDLIVTAISNNSLSSCATAINHDGDTYFSKCDLSKWEIWYDINNDTTKYEWADATNGKGVIYRMIDEFNNDVSYDFKNIQFKRWKLLGQRIVLRNGSIRYLRNSSSPYKWSTSTTQDSNILYTNTNAPNTSTTLYTDSNLTTQYSTQFSLEIWYVEDLSLNNNYLAYNDNTINTLSGYAIDSTQSIWCYTFNYNNSSVKDQSVECYNNNENFCYNNKISNELYNSDPTRYLNNICFVYCGDDECCNNTFGNFCYDMSFGNSCYSNTFGNNCYYNTFGNDCDNNTFGDDYHNNTFGESCYSNTFGNNCYNNTFGESCNSNTFGNNCQSNTFGNDCGNNTFGSGCYSNTFSDSCDSNTFRSGCRANTFRNYCESNTFGNNCYSNIFGTSCYNNTFGESCNSNTFGNDCYSNTLGCGCNHITIRGSEPEYGKLTEGNRIGNNCNNIIINSNSNNNAIGDGSSFILFGRNCISNSIGEECRNIFLDAFSASNSIGNGHNILSGYSDGFGFISKTDGNADEVGSVFGFCRSKATYSTTDSLKNDTLYFNPTGADIIINNEKVRSYDYFYTDKTSKYNVSSSVTLFYFNMSWSEYTADKIFTRYATKGNSIGNECENIYTDYDARQNSIGNGCHNITLGEHSRYNNFNNGCNLITLKSWAYEDGSGVDHYYRYNFASSIQNLDINSEDIYDNISTNDARYHDGHIGIPTFRVLRMTLNDSDSVYSQVYAVLFDDINGNTGNSDETLSIVTQGVVTNNNGIDWSYYESLNKSTVKNIVNTSINDIQSIQYSDIMGLT